MDTRNGTIDHERGESLHLYVSDLKEPDGTVVADDTGLTAAFVVKDADGTVVVSEAVSLSGYTAAAGATALCLSKTDSAALSAGRHTYWLRVFLGATISRTVKTGTLNITDGAVLTEAPS